MSETDLLSRQGITCIPVFSVGIGLRFGLHAHPDSKILYIAEYILVVLSVSVELVQWK